ncbi:MAG: hypothetical protein HY926_09900 [Elusimicrobia bacterium]|nr:hypothetical protein [Elusimicrobiota bacterium]
MKRPAGGPFRLMLVELSPDAPQRLFRTAAYPFLMGLARACGWRCSWCVLGVRYDPTVRYMLAPADLGRLRTEAARRRPHVIVLNEWLPREQLAALRRAGGSRTVYSPMDDDLHSLGDFIRRRIRRVEEPRLDGPGLLDAIRPVFRRRILNRAPWAAAPRYNIVAGARCSYRTPAAANPFFRRLRVPQPTMGCSFCDTPMRRPPTQDPAACAAAQVAAACRERPAGGGELHFNLVGSELWLRLEDFTQALLRARARGAELAFMPRADELLAGRAALRRCLPLLARRRLAVRLYGMGVENFSESENRRLNKGITAEQVHEAAAFIAETTRRWPGDFRFQSGTMSMILFTPWTSLQDLLCNARNIARCPLICPYFVLGQRLQLFPGRPITLLAERDGLLAPARRDRFYNSGCIISFDQQEVPWRFRHPEVALLWSLGRRICAGHGRSIPGDPEAQAIAVLLDRYAGPDRDPMPLFVRAIGALARRPGTGSLDELLRSLLPATSSCRRGP